MQSPVDVPESRWKCAATALCPSEAFMVGGSHFENRPDVERARSSVYMPDEATKQAIKRILDSAAQVTDLAFSVANEELEFIVTSDRPHFCRDFAHEQCPGLREQCQACDKRHISEMLQHGESFAVYDCDPLSLKDFVVPVKHLGRPVLYVFGGAVLPDRAGLDSICDRLTAHGSKLPRTKLRARVEELLPIVEPPKIQSAVEIVRGMATLLEDVLATSWREAKLKSASRIDAVRRRVIGDLQSTQTNPIWAVGELAEALAQEVRADACCVWKKDELKDSLFSLITSGFKEQETRRLSCLDPRSSLTARAMQGGRHEIVEDIVQFREEALLPLKGLLLDMGLRSLLCVPVKSGGEIVGAVTIYRRHPGGFAFEDVELVEELAQHVWEAISKAEFSRFLLAQADVSRMLNTDHDSDALYDSIADKVKDWLGARGCSIFFLKRGNGDEFELKGTTGIRGDRRDKVYRKGQGLTGWVAETGKALRVYNCGDAAELAAIDPRLKWGGTQVVEAVEDDLPSEALRPYLACPITVGHEVCGVVRVYVAAASRPVFSFEDEQLLTALAQEVGVGWKRFRLDEEAEEAEEASRASKKMLEDVLSVHQAVAQQVKAGTQSTLEVVRLACERIAQWRPTWEWVNVRVPDEARKSLRFFYLRGPGREKAQEMAFALKRGGSLGADSYLGGREIYCPDIAKEPRYACPYQEEGARSCFMLPMKVFEERIGLLTVDSSQLDDFDDKAKEYLRLLATQLSTAFTLSSSIEALREADIEKRAHLEAMAHQLIAPLSALRMHCENLLETRLTPERGRKVLGTIAAQSRIAARTASNFGILADILIGRAPGKGLVKSQQNVARLVVEIARDYQPMAWADEKELTANVQEGDKILASYDNRTFPQAVGNVIENAVKYSDDFSSIHIDVGRQPGLVRIQVADQGIRLMEEDAERIFDRNYRSADARRKFPSGTGIGLEIARSIVQAHDGKLYAIPTDASGWTKFVIELPRQ